jgi:fission process protein 1
MVAVKRSVFQGLASMALPAFTIHTAVKMATKRLANSPNPALKRWAPTAVGLGIVPALPYLFDEPVSIPSFDFYIRHRQALIKQVEHVVDMAFDTIEKQSFSSKPASPSSSL